MQHHHLAVGRTARYVTIGPASGSREVWFVCHGYGQLAPYFIRHFAPLDNDTRLIVAPEALSRFYLENPGGRHGNARVGATWMTREDREVEIRDYVSYLDTLYDRVMSGLATPPRVTALGFSQGVATVARWIGAGRSAAHRLVLWGEHLPPDLDLNSVRDVWRGTDLVLVSGDQDPAVTPERIAADEARLKEAGISFRIVRFPGGHEIHPGTLLALAGA